MQIKVLVTVACLLPGACATPARIESARSTTPTLILTGGRVFTADTARPWVEAVAIRGDRITAVGTTAEVRRLAGEDTREIALGGRVVIPGINDAHDHLGEAALGPEFLTVVSPTPDPTSLQVLDSLRALATRTPRGTWLRTQVGLRVLNDSAVDRATLDRIAPDHPIMLHGWWGHGLVLNSAALSALKTVDGVPDPLGGWYGRSPDGRLNGHVEEYAKWDAQRRLGAMQPETTLVAALRNFGTSSLRMGVTSVQNMADALPPGLTARVFREARLPIRVRLIRWSIPTATSMNEREWDTVTVRVTPGVVVDGRKWVLDGTPIEQFALRRTPYPGRPGWYGRLNFPPDTLRAILAAALRPGATQLHLHVVGDSTAELVLNTMEALASDAEWRTRRVRFEHGVTITGARIERVARKGIVIAQPRGGVPYRSWRAAGIPVAYGSDMLRNPFVHMMTAITGGDHPEEAISREEAVRIYTFGSAFAELAENEKGTLAPGKLADLAVLSQDVFAVPAAALPATRSVLTIVGGEVVYDATLSQEIAMDEKSLFTTFWTNESKTTRNVLARIPEKSDYRPDPKSRTAQEIAWQIVCEEKMIIDALENGKAEWAPPPMPATMKEVVAAYETQSDRMAQRWKALPADRWDGKLEFFGGERPASPMAWSFLFDIVHHRGQITTYLRPMGSKVPQIYGPSGDEP